MSSAAKAKNKPQAGTYNGADAVVDALRAQGVELIFGMVGGQIMPVYDALHRHHCFGHVLVGHEQGAAHMAEGYARATGKPGVIMTTSGPGATNLVTGLADAFMDSTPVVAITGQVASTLLGNDAFQEADMRGITMPITKHNYQVQNADDLPEIFAEAFYVALSGRPGPVLIDLPRDVAVSPCQPRQATPMPPTGYKPPFKPHPLQVERALSLMAQAQRPVIIAGGGVIHAGAHESLRKLAELTGFPVSTTLMGLGGLPADHPLSLGMPGMHGTGYANLAIYNADLLLVVGCRLDDRVTGNVAKFSPGSKVIHVDVDASEIGKNLECQVPIVGDAGQALAQLLAGAQAWPERPDTTAWRKQIDQWKKKYPMVYPKSDDVIAPQWAIQEVGKLLAPEDIVVTGVGQHQMFVAQYYPFRRPRTMISSGGLGTMGFGLPAAIGAQMGAPERQVVCFDGDGSFLMNIQELATAVRYRVPLVAVVLNNAWLGMVAQWQRMFYDRRMSQSETAAPPYDKVAQAFGALGKRVERPEEFVPAMQWALREAKAQKLPVVLDVMIEREAKVLPMVPPGGANAEFIPCQSGDCQ
ncbi:acetolactate synthase, large subunit, biosynthetic type [Desulfarculus baarsii DSM 2075]|uniref:Acetolactate synthase n=1 Tax=Desulfarculus baarsii (strain ATCC 33931 / DSM 2075 / LMG 7858 / VKM B-1802 / 2st14) TaxID=644282 RepID=E1QDS6_DESB2|nr:biosynthetic-type acetolactate synthase large subunit [Desulfarculus baarsii]ADK83712.1 acetolactate synthase, large subunit, biosynthetic type [Desulfarculus baarsii DSM 2075]